MSEITRKEFSDLHNTVSSMKKDVSDLKDWQKYEANPMIDKVIAFENQLVGAKKLLLVIAIGLSLLVGEKFSERIPFKYLFDLFSAQLKVDDTVRANTVMKVPVLSTETHH